MRKLVIQQVENGFIVQDAPEHSGMVATKTHVFNKVEGMEGLAKWIEMELRPGGADRGEK